MLEDQFMRSLSKKSNQFPTLINPIAVEPEPTTTPIQNVTCNIECPINELCQLIPGKTSEFECVCPQELSLFRIYEVCREYIGNMPPCSVNKDIDCNLINNEECVPVDMYTNQGTCQCKSGFRRDKSTYECQQQEYSKKMDSFYENLRSTEYNGVKSEKLLERKRPQIAEKPTKNFYREIVDEIIKNNDDDYTDLSNNLIISTTIPTTTTQSTTTEPIATTTTTKTTTTTSTTTTTAEPQFTDSPKIFTKNLMADAGKDIQIHYPSTSCILNGSLSKVHEGQITKMTWTKLDGSPAFGVSQIIFWDINSNLLFTM